MPDLRPGSDYWPTCDGVLVMYRNGAHVDFNGRSKSVTGACAWQYLYSDNFDWWPLAANECLWIVPGTHLIEQEGDKE